jgi:hypothetical protein
MIFACDGSFPHGKEERVLSKDTFSTAIESALIVLHVHNPRKMTLVMTDYSTDPSITCRPMIQASQAPAQSGSLRTSNLRISDWCRENDFRQYQRMSTHRRLPYMLMLVIRVGLFVSTRPGYVLVSGFLGTEPTSSADADA